MFSYVHNHDDGRVSYPMLFIFISPQGKCMAVKDFKCHTTYITVDPAGKQSNYRLKQPEVI